MKMLQAKTKLYPRFVRVPIKILDESAAIMVHSKLLSIGKKGEINGKDVRVAFCSDAQLKFFMDMQERYKQPQEYYGKVKDNNFFTYGMHKWSCKNYPLQRKKRRDIKEREDTERIYAETESQIPTGLHRSGDLRFHSPILNLETKFKEDA